MLKHSVHQLVGIVVGIIALLVVGSACGVKGSPVSPIRPDEVATEKVVVECSVYDPSCAEEDPEYVTGLDPKNPKDAAIIKKLEAARKKSGRQKK